MATTKMPVLGTKKNMDDMPVLGEKQPGTQKASPAVVPKITGDISGEAWTRATPSQTKVPEKKQTNSLLTKTEKVAVGGSRGGRTIYQDVEMPTLAGRAVKVASSLAKSTAGTFSDATRALYEAGQKSRTARDTELQSYFQRQLDRANRDLTMMLEDNRQKPGTWPEADLQSQRNIIDDAQRKLSAMRQVTEGQVQQKATQEVNAIVDQLDESAAADTQEAKRGLGKVGSAVVDLGTAGLQLAADRVVGSAMGIGTMPVLAMRVFGGGTKEARQAGASLEQQLTYGAESALVSAATEQLSNVAKPFAKAFGAGVTDDVVESAISRAVSRAAKTAAGKTVLEGVLKTGVGFLGEGTEEFLEDVANPILKRMTYDPNARFDLEEAAYDFLIGGALGGLGGAVEGVTGAKGRYQGYQTEIGNAAIDSAYDTMREKGMFSQEARKAVRDAEDIMPKLDPGGNIAWGRMMEQVQPDRQEAFTQAREIADRFGADLVVDKLANGAAGEYRNNVVTIDPAAADPVRQVLVHELTHHMETSGLYSQFSDRVLGFVAQDMNVDVDALKQSIITEYQANNVTLDSDGATRELVAKFAEDKLFQDEASIRRLLQADRNLFQKVYDWIRDTIAKVRGTGEERFLIDAQNLYEKALREAGTLEGTGAGQNTFGGVNARTADLNALWNAQELERQGMDADAIRRQTGWFRGMDGKWRFEIDDSGMEYRRDGDSRLVQEDGYRRMMELSERYDTLNEAERMELGNLEKEYGDAVWEEKYRLDDYLVHDDLFKAYPRLHGVSLVFDDLADGQKGFFDRRSNTIVLDEGLRSEPESTLIHEIQHLVQKYEDFARGSSTEYWNQRVEDGFSKRWASGEEMMPSELYRNTAGEIEARDAAARRQLTPEQQELKMPQLGDENTVFAEDGDAGWHNALEYDPESASIKQQLENSRDRLNAMEIVASASVPVNLRKKDDAAKWVFEYLKNTGYRVDRQGYGEIYFSKKDIDKGLRYADTPAEKAALAVMPQVLKRGIEIGDHNDHKGRSKQTITFAAPVELNGVRGNMGIVVNRNGNHYYAHRIVLPDGSEFRFSNEKTNATQELSRGVTVSGSLADTTSAAFKFSIPGQRGNVNEDITPKLVDENGMQYSMGRSFSELVQNQRDGVELGSDGQMAMRGFDDAGEPDIMPKIEDIQEPPVRGEPTVEDLLRQAEAQPPDVTPVQPRRQNQNAMDTLGIHPVGDMGDYSNTEFQRGADKAKKDTARARRQAEARLQPTRSEKKFAKGIANGDYTVDDIPASMRRSVVEELSDYYIGENSFKAVDGVREQGRRIRETTEQMAAKLFEDDESFKPISMLRMNERTPERVMRSIFGDEQGERINERYIYPVQQNEAEKMRFIQRQLDEVRTFEDSRGQRSPLTKDERAIVQQIMEDRFVGEIIASMEMAGAIRNAAENIRNGADPIDAAREFSLDAEERGLAQQLARWTRNQEMLSSGQLDSVKINNAVKKFVEQYDLFYDAVNDFLTAHGYGTIGFIKGYAPHMQGADTQNKLLSALRSMGVNTDASNLPTSISGLTADYKPGKRWNPFFQSRAGEKTDYDVYKGFESYVSYLGDIFYHTDDIARLRGVSRYLRKTYGPEEISNAIDHAESLRNADLNTQTEVLKDAGKITEGTKLTYEDSRRLMDEYIDELYENVTKVTKYGEFVKYIDNYANLLAGKQSMADRGMEYMAGRTSLNAGNKLVAAFGRAQVAGNVSSVLNQSAQLSQILAEVPGKYVAKAAASLAEDTRGKLWNVKKTELFNQSDLLTGKKGIEYLTADDSKFDRMVSAMFKPADIMDSMVSALAVQSKYEQLLAEGKPSEVAMLEADRWATQVMASRMKGSRPMAFESKSMVNQMLHMFQVEALNSWEHLSQDMPYKYRRVAAEHGKKAASRAVATVVTKGLVSAFLLNRVAEAAYGGTPAPFDVLGYITNFISSGMGMTANEALKQLVNAGWERMFGEALLDDDEDKEKKPFDWSAAAEDAVYNVSNDIPFVRNAAGLLGLGDQTMPFTNMAEAAKGVGKALTAEEKSAGEIGGSLLELGSTMIPGGRQLQKTAQGVQTMLQGGRTYGYGSKARMQYPVEQTPGNWAQAVLFGNSGLDETREFYASGESGLSAKQTGVVKLLTSEGGDPETVYNAIQRIRKGNNTKEKLESLNSAAGLNDRQRWQLYTDVIADQSAKKPEQFRQMLLADMTWDQISNAYLKYMEIDETEGLGAQEKATQFAAYLDRGGLSEKQKGMVQEALKYYSQIPAEAKRYETLTEVGLSSASAEGLSSALGSLTPEAGETSVSNVQRYRAVVDYGLSERNQMKALEAIMEESEFEKLSAAYAVGVTPAQYVDFKERTQDLAADKVNGKTVSGSKKAKVMAAIDSMQISNSQKTALYYAAGYKESTLDDAPWISGNSSWVGPDIMPKLTAAEEFQMPVLGGDARNIQVPMLAE